MLLRLSISARLAIGFVVFLCSIALVRYDPTSAQSPPDNDLVTRARAIHDRVITLDTHVDINPANFTGSGAYATRLATQVNVPKMEEGGLDAAFFVVYVGQATGADAFTPKGYEAAYRLAIEKFDAIDRLTNVMAPDRIALARSAADVRRIAASGKKVALIGVENGYPIGEDVGRVREFHARGARYMSLAHNGHSQLADSNTGERDGFRWNGLSPLGREVIAAMNAHGIMIDVSHPSKASMMQAIQLSTVPIIASHSSVRALCDHSRNLDDEQLMAIAANGGVAQMTAFAAYVKTPMPDVAERVAALASVRREFGIPETAAGRGAMAAATSALPADRLAAYQAGVAEVDRQWPPAPGATLSDFVDHIDYAVKKVGIDHVGISSDFDGGGGVTGWNDASETFNVTLELVRRGYNEEQIGRLWSGNLLRVMEAVERGATVR
jgi:membrane dipeptidase